MEWGSHDVYIPCSKLQILPDLDAISFDDLRFGEIEFVLWLWKKRIARRRSERLLEPCQHIEACVVLFKRGSASHLRGAYGSMAHQEIRQERCILFDLVKGQLVSSEPVQQVLS